MFNAAIVDIKAGTFDMPEATWLKLTLPYHKAVFMILIPKADRKGLKLTRKSELSKYVRKYLLEKATAEIAETNTG